MKRVVCTLACVLSCLYATAAHAQTAALTVVNAGPQGPIASLAEANEIRVVFSEPMVTLGRIPAPVRAPFFQHHTGGSRHVPLVGDDHPDLHAGREASAAICDHATT